MRVRRAVASPASGTEAQSGAPAEAPASPRPKGHRIWRRLGIVLAVIVVLLGVVRLFLPQVARDYVNRTLDRNPIYSGRIGVIEIHLWRGAYAIRDVSISKTTGDVPVPFFAAKRVDFSLQWDALLHGKIVGRVVMEQPEINFVDAPSSGEAQSGAGGPWLELISDLFPFRINSAVVQNGAVHFRAYQGQTPVDVYLSDLSATIDNLGNIQEQATPLAARVAANGLVMDQAKFELRMTLDPFSYQPTFHLGVRLLGLDVTRLNDLALHYGKFDFKHGWFDLVIEADAKEGQMAGYIKPLFRDLKVFSLSKDIKEDNAIQFFWQAVLGAATSLFKNQPRNQFGTVIPFSTDLSGSAKPDLLATIGNLLRNAFIRAYLPRLENGGESFQGMQFGTPELSDPVSAGD